MRCASRQAGPRFGAHILECSITQISKHGVRLPVVLLRVDVGILAHVGIGTKQVLVSVIVKIVNARTPAAHLDTAKANARHVSISAKEAIPLVAKEREGLTPKGSHEQARFSVIVPVAKVDTHAGYRYPVFGVGHEGLDADLVESMASPIPEQEIPVVVVID